MEEEICDIDVFEEESEDEETSSDIDQETNGGSSENEDQVPTTADSVTYYVIPFPGRLRRRNMLTQQLRIDAALEYEMDVFMLFYQPEIIP